MSEIPDSLLERIDVFLTKLDTVGATYDGILYDEAEGLIHEAQPYFSPDELVALRARFLFRMVHLACSGDSPFDVCIRLVEEWRGLPHEDPAYATLPMGYFWARCMEQGEYAIGEASVRECTESLRACRNSADTTIRSLIVGGDTWLEWFVHSQRARKEGTSETNPLT